MSDLADRRRDYTGTELIESVVARNPFEQFARWMSEALADESIYEPTAITLATASAEGRPSARVMLLKGIDERGFVFFSNYESRKGTDLATNPMACLLAYWDRLHRQVRIEGTVERLSREETTAYFRTRPRGSQIAAWASKQSSTIAGRAELQERFEHFERSFEGRSDIEPPESWGGYRLVPDRIEFWQGRENRLHDRLLYTLDNDGSWSLARLSP